MKHIFKNHLVRAEPPSLCAPERTKEGSIASCNMLPSHLMFTQVCHCVSLCVKNRSCCCEA